MIPFFSSPRLAAADTLSGLSNIAYLGLAWFLACECTLFASPESHFFVALSKAHISSCYQYHPTCAIAHLVLQTFTQSKGMLTTRLILTLTHAAFLTKPSNHTSFTSQQSFFAASTYTHTRTHKREHAEDAATPHRPRSGGPRERHLSPSGRARSHRRQLFAAGFD